MRVSIIIINYNCARFLSQAIDSALAQTYADTEIVIVDDGSMDESAEIINSYGSRVRSVFKSNGGQLSCYTRGLASASGRLILYLDADDFLCPECVSEVVATWTAGCVKVHFYLMVVDEHGAQTSAVVPSGRLSTGPQALKMMRRFGTYCSPPASGNVYHREFLAEILPREDDARFKKFEVIRFGGDSVPILAAPFFGAVKGIPKVLGYYRRHAGAGGAVTPEFSTVSGLQLLEKEYARETARDSAWQLATGRSEPARLPEPSRLKRRFCYLRLSGRGLDPGDDRLSLSLQGMKSAFYWDGYAMVQKLAAAVWFVAVGLLPLRMAVVLIRPALGLSHRSTGLKRFLRLARSGANGQATANIRSERGAKTIRPLL